MFLPYRVLLAGYRSTADSMPVVGVSSSDCTTQVADEVVDAAPVAGIFKPDLIILYDLAPECGALQVMKRLKRNPDTEDIPVILIVPDRDDAGPVIRGLDAGADDCLPVSTDRRELLARIKAVMRRTDAARELQYRREALFLQATTDPLTGLYNRQYLKPLIERNLASLKRCHRHCSLLMLEIVNLTALYETSGRLVGDGVMREIGRMVKGSLRAGDLAVRYDKHLLIVVLPDTGTTGSFSAAERLRTIVEGHSFPAIAGTPIRANMGITELMREDADMADIIERAEKALAASRQEEKKRGSRL